MNTVTAEFTPAQIAADAVLSGMVRDKLELTRENYLIRQYPEGLPEPWSAELEAELPEQFQDWSQFDEDEHPDFQG